MCLELYEVDQRASRKKCDLPGCSQKIIAFRKYENGLMRRAEWFSSKNINAVDADFPHIVRTVLVMAHNGTHAIEKFLEWENNGYGKEWLMEENQTNV